MCCAHNSQCGGIWQEKGFFSSLTMFNSLLLFLLRSRRFWLPRGRRFFKKRVLRDGGFWEHQQVIPVKKSVNLYLKSSDSQVIVTVVTSSFETQPHLPSYSHIQARNLATQVWLAGALSLQDNRKKQHFAEHSIFFFKQP